MSVFEITLAAAVFGLWLRDGAPVLRVVRSWLGIGPSGETDPNR